jgi:hypothetical protein
MKTQKFLLGVTFALFATITHAELVQQFKSPAFNGQGWSSHVLTIDTIEKNRADAIESQRKADAAKLQADQLNTPLNRFMSLFQSQVYAQLATQLSNNLFQNNCKGSDGAAIPGCVNPTTGTFKLDGNTVTWNKQSESVTLTVVDSVGSVTKIVVPIASFSF